MNKELRYLSLARAVSLITAPCKEGVGYVGAGETKGGGGRAGGQTKGGGGQAGGKLTDAGCQVITEIGRITLIQNRLRGHGTALRHL